MSQTKPKIIFSLYCFLFWCFIFSIGIFFCKNRVVAQDESQIYVDELQKRIEEKTIELNTVSEKRGELKKNLEEISKTKSALTKDIRLIDYNVRQLDLAVESNKLTIDKLELELDSLDKNIQLAEQTIANKKEVLGKLLTLVNERDKESMLVTFLKNRSLAESISEFQSLAALNSDLTFGILELKNLQTDLVKKMAFAGLKKTQKETEKTNLINRQYITQSQKQDKQRLLSQTKNQAKIYEDKMKELEKQQEDISKVIEEIEYELRATFDPTLLPLKKPGVIAFPVTNPQIVQKYGKTKFAERAYKTKFHTGVDFDEIIGAPVFSAEDGEVIRVDNNDKSALRWQKFQYGMYIMIKHQNNLSTLYAHLSKAIVKAGDTVSRGVLIGYIGNTGYSTGPHLHFGVYWSPSVQFKSVPPANGLVPIGITVNPEEYL